MKKVGKTMQKINLIVLLLVFMVFILIPANISQASTEVIPSDNQYLEMRATTITEVEGQGKQLIMELWGHDIDFKRI